MKFDPQKLERDYEYIGKVDIKGIPSDNKLFEKEVKLKKVEFYEVYSNFIREYKESEGLELSFKEVMKKIDEYLKKEFDFDFCDLSSEFEDDFIFNIYYENNLIITFEDHKDRTFLMADIQSYKIYDIKYKEYMKIFGIVKEIIENA